MLQGEPTGLFDLKKDDSFFKVFPNPTTGSFTLSLTGVDMTSQVTVEIFTMLGATIEKIQLPAFSEREFDLSARAPGIYLVKVKYGDKTGMSKVIKQ
jgi:hypothetical protein